MTFDELKFKAEDFFPAGDTLDYWKKETADEANRILSEKLTPLLTEIEELRKLKEEVDRAPEHYMFYQDGMRWSHEIYLSKDTQRPPRLHRRTAFF